MSVFPMQPIGDVVICEVLSKDLTAGGIHLPNGNVLDEYVVGKVIAAGTGNYSAMGSLIPCSCSVGDVVVYQQVVAKKISFAVARHLIDRGQTQEYLGKLNVVMTDHVVCKIRPLTAEEQAAVDARNPQSTDNKE